MTIKARQQGSEDRIQKSDERPEKPTSARRPPGSGMTPTLLNLQRTHGNRYVENALSVARKADGEAEAAPGVEEAVRQTGDGHPLDEKVRGQMESALGADFSGVRVHTDSEADALGAALNARAFTTGSDIFFRQGEYDPGSATGRELLAHELTHVVQQKRGGGVQRKVSISEPGDACEQEADEVARSFREREQQPGSGAAQVVTPRLTSESFIGLKNGPPGPSKPSAPAPAKGSTPAPATGTAPAQTPAAPAVSVSIAEVNAPNTPASVKRIPPRVDTSVVVTVSGTPSSPITLSIDGAGAANGEATINGSTTHNITGTETVKLKGDTQTTPGNAGKLKLVADQGGTRLASSNAFSVAAYPIEVQFTFKGILQNSSIQGLSGNFWGATYDATFISDSGDIADCDETKISEVLQVDSAEGFFAGFPPTQSNFLRTVGPQTDNHAVQSRTADRLRKDMEKEPNSNVVLHQFFRFSDKRTGIAESKTSGPKVPTSGFKIGHWFTTPETCGGSSHIVHTKKEGFANNDVAAGTVDDTSVQDAAV